MYNDWKAGSIVYGRRYILGKADDELPKGEDVRGYGIGSPTYWIGMNSISAAFGLKSKSHSINDNKIYIYTGKKKRDKYFRIMRTTWINILVDILKETTKGETRDNIIVSHFSLSLSFYFHEKSSLFICSTGGRRILFSLGNVSMTRKMVRSLLLVISGVAQSLLFFF